MANQPTKYRKFVVGAASAALVASAVAPVASAAESNFTDIKGYDVKTQEHVNALVKRGIITGTSETTFSPGDSITRGQVVKLLGRYLVESGKATVPADWDSKQRFSDVPVSFKDKDLVKNAAVVYDAGVFKGNEGVLNSAGKITRENMALVLDRAAEAIGGSTLVELASGKENTVTDIANAKTEAQEAIKALNALEISTVNEFKPKNNVQRVHFATFLYNTMVVLGDDFKDEDEDVVNDLKVTGVTAITSTSVTVDIDAPKEDLADQTVVVKDGAGKTYAVNPTTIKAGATSATFSFVTPLTVSPTTAWTVNGVSYKVSELAIVAVESTDTANKTLVVEFNSPLKSLDATEITIREKVSQTRSAVESVKLATDGMSAQITLVGFGDARIDGLTPGKVHTLSITKNGSVVSTDFVIPDVIEDATVTSVSAKENTITIAGHGTYKLAKDVVIDFQEARGRDITVWLNEDKQITKYNYSVEAVELDAVKISKKDNKWYATTVAGDKTYQIKESAPGVAKLSAGAVTLQDGLVYDSAKLVIDKDGTVQSFINYSANDASNVLLVSKVTDTYVQSADSELNLSDYDIVKNGKTIKISDIQKGEVLFYNTTNKVAEVYTNKVSGTISDFYKGEFRLNGTKYTYGDADQRILVDDEFVTITDLEIEPFTGAVEVYLDRTGKVKFITGEELASNLDNPTYITSAVASYDLAKDGYVKFTSQDAAGKAVEQTIKVKTLKEVGDFKVGKEYSGGPVVGKIAYFELDGKAIKAYNKDDSAISTIINDVEAAGEKGKIVEVIKNTNGDIIGLNFPTQKGTKLAKEAKSTDKTVTVGTTAYKVDANTPVFVEIETGKVNSSTWGKVNTSKITTAEGVWVFADDEKQVVDYILIKHDSQALSDDTNFDKVEAVITSVSKNTDDEVVEISAYVNGELKAYKVDLLDTSSLEDVTIGQIVDLQVTKDEKPVVKTISADTDNVDGVDTYVYVPNTTLTSSGKIVVGGVEKHTIESSAKFYELTTDLNGKPIVKKYDGLSSFKAEADKLEGKQITVSTIAAGNKSVDIVVLSNLAPIEFTSIKNIDTANDVATLGLTGTVATSSDTAIATVSLVSDADKVAITSVAAGEATITVKDADNKQATIPVTVNANGSITLGSITKYENTADSTTIDWLIDDKTAVSAEPTVAVVSGYEIGTAGKVTVTAVKPGTTTVTVTHANNSTTVYDVTVSNTGAITVVAQ